MSAAASKRACINQRPGEVMHEIKTRTLVKAIWTHLRNDVGVRAHGFHRATNRN